MEVVFSRNVYFLKCACISEAILLPDAIHSFVEHDHLIFWSVPAVAAWCFTEATEAIDCTPLVVALVPLKKCTVPSKRYPLQRRKHLGALFSIKTKHTVEFCTHWHCKRYIWLKNLHVSFSKSLVPRRMFLRQDLPRMSSARFSFSSSARQMSAPRSSASSTFGKRMRSLRPISSNLLWTWQTQRKLVRTQLFLFPVRFYFSRGERMRYDQLFALISEHSVHRGFRK